MNTPISSNMYIQFQQSLLILVHYHLLKRRCAPILSENRHDIFLRDLIRELHAFTHKVGFVSSRFFESSFSVVHLLFQSITFRVVAKELPKLLSLLSIFKSRVCSVFLHVVGSFDLEEFHCYSHFVTGLKLKLMKPSDLNFLNKSSPFNFSYLKTLDVRIESSILMDFLEALKEVNCSLTHINLARNSIAGENAIILAKILKINTSINEINLGHNSIGAHGTIALADALKVNRTLIKINLRSNSIRHEGAKELAEALKVNTTITELDLFGNSIGSDGIIPLAEALKINCSITKINLSQNNIGSSGISSLADALKVNCSVTDIKLGSNFIVSTEGKRLAEMLKVNSCITTISLYNNYLDSNSAIALAEALKVNSCITAIILGRNCIGREGIEALAKV
ncbi:hypothetical protein GEMRC1_000955 [Eukaryota sp. GEM-RC1]